MSALSDSSDISFGHDGLVHIALVAVCSILP